MTMIHLTVSARRLAAASGLLLLLAGCSILPKREPVQIWRPTQAAVTKPATVSASNADFSLRIDMPTAIGLLDSTSIVVMPAPGKISTYKGARWSEPPALLMRRRLVDAFMAARLSAVTTRDDAVSTDYTLSGDLRAFQSQYRSGSPVIVVRYDAQLRGGSGQRLLASHSFVVTQTPSNAQVPAVVTAFGAADNRLARDVVAWTVKVVGHAGRTRGRSTGL
jgi:cholesterol transport system auxiliary component